MDWSHSEPAKQRGSYLRLYSKSVSVITLITVFLIFSSTKLTAVDVTRGKSFSVIFVNEIRRIVKKKKKLTVDKIYISLLVGNYSQRINKLERKDTVNGIIG